MSDEEKLGNGALNPTGDNGLPNGEAGEEDDEFDEFIVGITEDGDVSIEGPGCDLLLAPEEARELGKALIETADEAEKPEE
jgi:hypothetical protein